MTSYLLGKLCKIRMQFRKCQHIGHLYIVDKKMYFHFIFLLTVNIKKTWVAAIPGKSLVPGYSHDVFFTLKPRHPDTYSDYNVQM